LGSGSRGGYISQAWIAEHISDNRVKFSQMSDLKDTRQQILKFDQCSGAVTESSGAIFVRRFGFMSGGLYMMYVSGGLGHWVDMPEETG